MAKSVSKVIVWQTVSRFLMQGISIITTPIFTRLLTTLDYGKFSTYNAWVSIIGIIVGLQTYGSIANAKIKYDENEYKQYLSSVFSISLLSYIVCIIISFFLKDNLAVLFSIDSKLVPVMFLNSFFSFCTTFYSQILIQDKRIEANAFISLTIAVLTMVFSILFVKTMMNDKYIGRIYGTVIPLAIIGVFEIVMIYKSGHMLYNLKYWSFCLTFTLPLIFHGLSGLILSQSDRIMLTKIVGEEVTGVYGVAYSMGAIMDIIRNSFNTAWLPFYYGYKKNNDNENLKARSKNYMVVFTIITMGFILCVPEVFKIITTKEYWGGIMLLPFIVVSYYFDFLYSFLVNFEFYYEKTKLISIGTVFSAVINFILNCILIPQYTAIGAAIATVISYVFLFIFHYIIANYVMKENCEYKISFLIKGMIPIIILSIIYYFVIELWIIRWITALTLGLYLVYRVIKQRTFI